MTIYFPRDKIAQIADENGWHRVVDLGAPSVDDYTRRARRIHIVWSPRELAKFIEIDGVMLSHQHADVVDIDGQDYPDTESALATGVPAALRGSK